MCVPFSLKETANGEYPLSQDTQDLAGATWDVCGGSVALHCLYPRHLTSKVDFTDAIVSLHSRKSCHSNTCPECLLDVRGEKNLYRLIQFLKTFKYFVYFFDILSPFYRLLKISLGFLSQINRQIKKQTEHFLGVKAMP